jgi:peptide/nickel transport system substrate-binding protein
MDRTVAEVIQGQLKEVGIDAELKVLEWGTYAAVRSAMKETRLFIMGNGNPPLDLDFLLYKSFATTGSMNTSGYSNPEVDKLLEAQRVTVDSKKRREILLKAQQLIHEDSPWICLYYEFQNIGVRSDVKGMRVNPNEQLYFTALHRE